MTICFEYKKFFYLNIIAYVVGSEEKYLANKSLQADVMDDWLA